MRRSVTRLLVLATTVMCASCSGCGGKGSSVATIEMPADVQRAIRSSVDSTELVADLGKDPLKIFEWVRSSTRLVPYRGLLRGADGVLIDRRGNSLDRSLLLAQTLKSAGWEVRLSHGTLTPGQASQLLESSRAAASGTPAAVTPSGGQTIAAESSTDAGESAVTNALRTRDVIQREFSAALASSRAAMTPFASTIRGSSQDNSPGFVASLQDHWWVQIKEGSNWTDYDPSAPDGRPGKALASGEPVALEAVDKELFHELEIRVVVEQAKGTELHEHTVLQHRIQPARLAGRSLHLNFVAKDWPHTAGSEEEAIRRFADDASAVTQWIPTITVGSEITFNKAFDRAGDLVAPGGKPAISTGAATAMTGMGSALGGDEPELPGRLTAVWVDYVITAPGQPGRTIRREFLDTIGPARRQRRAVAQNTDENAVRRQVGLALAGEVEILPLTADGSSEWIASLIARALDECQKAYAAVSDRTEIDFTAAGHLVAACADAPGPLHRLALLRQMPADRQPATFIKSVNVLALIRRPRLDPAGKVQEQQISDMVATGVGTFSTRERSWLDLAVEQGLRDGSAESLVFTDATSERSTAGLFRKVSGSAQPVFDLMHPADQSGLNKYASNEDTRARMAADLKEGHIIVATAAADDRRAGSVGWWRIDPRSGETVGVMDSGFNQDEVEYGFSDTLISKTLIWSGKLATKLAVSGVLGMLGTVLRFVVEKMYPVINGLLTPGSPIHRYLAIKAVEIHLWLAAIGNSPLKVFQR